MISCHTQPVMLWSSSARSATTIANVTWLDPFRVQTEAAVISQPAFFYRRLQMSSPYFSPSVVWMTEAALKQFWCRRFEGSSKLSVASKITVSLFTLTPEPGRAPTRVRAKSLSASEIEVSWKALPWNASKKRVLGYEVSDTEIPCLCVPPQDANMLFLRARAQFN